MQAATIDFETRSAEDLRKSGAWKYAEHDTTQIMCLAVKYKGIEFVWNPAYPSAGIPERNADLLADFLRYVEGGGLIEAHNSQFERAIWHHVGVGKLGWPAVAHEQWRCSAALAASYAIPRSLEGAALALGVQEQKDAAGSRVMKKISKPRLPLKADLSLVAKGLWGDESRWKEVPKPKTIYLLQQTYGHLPGVSELNMWHEKPEELEHLFAYCMDDVRAEHAVSERLGGSLNTMELAVWQLDQLMNQTGIRIDLEMVDTALALADKCKEESDERLSELTDGAVTAATQRDKLIEWINAQPCEGTLENTQKATIEDAVSCPELWTEEALEVLTIRLAQAKTSTKKYVSMRAVANADGRARGLLYYHGADTGRWAGRLIQPQNFPRGSVDGNIDDLCETITQGNREEIEFYYGGTMEALSSALRGAMVAGIGTDLICSDYSAIEARGTFWIANDTAALDVLNEGRDIYIEMATQIFNLKYEQIDKKSYMRQVGKQAILGLGYQMGAERYVDTCAGYGIDMPFELAEQIVKTYRTIHHPVRSFWYEVEDAAREAIQRGKGGDPVYFKRLQLAVSEDNFFQIRLPSRRKISYFEPMIMPMISKFQNDDLREVHEKAIQERWGVDRAMAAGLRIDQKITFMGVNSMTRKFTRQETYGGKLTENIVQGLSRDIMAEAMLRVHKTGIYTPLLTVHDEIIAEVNEGAGSVEDFERQLAILPSWAQGFPVEASEGWRGFRYRK